MTVERLATAGPPGETADPGLGETADPGLGETADPGPAEAGPGAALPDGWIRAELAALSACGPVRERNEDRLGWAIVGSPVSARSPAGDGRPVQTELRGPGVAVLVADGLGGHAHGALASRTAVGLLLRRLVEPDALERLPATLREGFESANEALLAGRLGESVVFDREPADMAGGRSDDVGPGHDAVGVLSRGGQTTLTALAITGRSRHLAHVGDCRVFRLRDGVLELLTTDHTQAMELLRMRLVRPDQVARHPGRHLLTRSIGGDVVLRVEARSGEPAVGDAYLLCSDGAWSAVTSGEVLAALEGDLGAGVADLVGRSVERGGEDNASVIALRLLELGGTPDAVGQTGWRLPWRRGPGG